MSAHLHGFGRYLPERVVGNASSPSVSARRRSGLSASGIRERRYAADSEGVVEMAVLAAQDCLRRVGASTIGMVIVASGSGSSGFPGRRLP